jgi:hypothetical protein
MAVIRLILLVAVLGGLTLLLVQNWSPALPLIFLGIRTQALPLAIWILFSTAAGGFTSLFVTSLFKLSNYLGSQSTKTSSNSRFTSPRKQSRVEESTTRTGTVPPPTGVKTESSRNPSDDWDMDSSNDDWDFDEERSVKSTTSPKNTERTYEQKQEPTSGNKSGSSYSYSYREPKNSGVGKTESVYDADYRVIVPPYQSPTENQQPPQVANQAEDDDWGIFDDDEEFEDDKRKR